MKIYFLGTNGWYNTKFGNTICTLIDSEEGYIIFDAGDGIHKAEKLLVENKPVYLFISHLHLDHISGFHIFTAFAKNKEIHIILGKGNKQLLENIVRHPYMNSLGSNVVFHEVEDGNYSEPLNFECRNLKHIDPSIGFNLKLENRNIAYCLDTDKCDNLITLAKNADILITEASMIPGISNSEWGHLNPEEAAQVARDAKVKKMVMTHISVDGYANLGERKEAEKKSKNIFKNSIMAEDDLIIELQKNMSMKKIQNAELKDKKVLLRADFNVAIENEDAREAYKIQACRESLIYLLSQDAKVALITHLGRPAAVKTLMDKPEGKSNPELSLGQLADDMERILDVKVNFVPDCIGEKVKEGLDNLKSGEILLLENVRLYEGEEKNDEEFSKKLAENFDIFINDAFSVCHRDQSSVTGVAKILPSFAGFWLQKEIENLDKIKNNPEHPAVAIIGGAKIETKIPLINNFEKIYDSILVGGKIANEAIDQNIQFSEKVMLPIDFSGDRLDIGKETTQKFVEIIKTAKTIVWNGPMGKFEESPYDLATKEVLKAVVGSGAYTLLGGGESVEILEKENAMDKISFVSTGGGAMLEYLSGNPMPGIEALKD